MKRGDQFRRYIRHLRRVVGYEAGLIATAWLYLTRIPLPPFAIGRIARKQYAPTESIRYIPLVGLLVGAIAGAVFLGANEVFESKALAVLLSLAASILVTNTAQLGGALMVLIKFQALLLVPAELIPSVLIAANAFSRFAAASFIGTHALVESDGHGRYKAVAKNHISGREFTVLAVLGIAPLLLVWNALFLLLVPLLWVIRNLYGGWFIGRVGGYTNYYLNMTQQLLEACCYLLVVVSFRYPVNFA